jgi:hypothetical protein
MKEAVMQRFLSIRSFANLETIWFVAVFGLSMIPKIISSVNGVIDPFTYSPMAVAQASLDSQRILIHPGIFEPGTGNFDTHAYFISERAAVTTILATVSIVTGLPVSSFRFMPVNGIILIILSYVLARVFTKSKLASGVFTIFVSYDPDINQLAYNVSYVGFGFSLFLVFVILLLKTLKSQDFFVRGVILLMMTFVATYFTYYTSEIDIVVLMIGITACLFVLRSSVHSATRTRSLAGLSLAFAMIFVMFDRIFYDNFARVAGMAAVPFLINYAFYVRSLFFLGETGVRGPSAFETSTQYIGLMVYGLILIPVAFYTLSVLIHYLRTRKRNAGSLDASKVVYLSLLFPWLIEIFGYGSRGKIPFKYILLVFSLLSVFTITRLRVRRADLARAARLLKLSLLCLLVILSMAKFGAWFVDPKLGYTGAPTGPVCSMASIVSHGTTLTDLDTGGLLLMELTQNQKISKAHVSAFSADTINFLHENDSERAGELFRVNGLSYLVLSRQDVAHSVPGFDWVDADPLAEAFLYPDGYTNFVRICSDEQFVVYGFTG